MQPLQDKTAFITGGSRGIGLAIGERLARDGARVVIAAKTDKPHRVLPGTIHTAAEAIEAAGGQALPLVMDVRDDAQVEAAMAEAAAHFGGIDILVNNASAIQLENTETLPMRRFDLMFGVNVRGTYTASRAALPYLKQSANAHILNLSPPLNLDPRWFRDHCAYTMAKYGMSLCVLGMSEEFREHGIAVNALWPRTVIATAAINLLPGVRPENCRTPAIMGDAAHAILSRDARECTGNFFIDDEVLAEAGVGDLDAYAVAPGQPLLPDLFL